MNRHFDSLLLSWPVPSSYIPTLGNNGVKSRIAIGDHDNRPLSLKPCDQVTVSVKDSWCDAEIGSGEETETSRCKRVHGHNSYGNSHSPPCHFRDSTSAPFKLTSFRMSIGCVGDGLIEFACSKDYVTAIRCAMKVHAAAYEKANILHQDISVGNILITDEGGLLIDWELPKRPNNEPAGEVVDLGSPRRGYRTGTWQFIAGMILENVDRLQVPEYLGDLESFFWVLLWVALNHVPSNQSPGELKALITLFDEPPNLGVYQGEWKRLHLKGGFTCIAFPGVRVLRDLIRGCAKTLSWHYLDPPSQK